MFMVSCKQWYLHLYTCVGPACIVTRPKRNARLGASIDTPGTACAERKKLKRRASKAGDELHSDQESGERMSDGNHHPAGGHGGGGAHSNADMSTALVQYNQQHSQDFAAMLRGYPEISEVPSPAQVLQVRLRILPRGLLSHRAPARARISAQMHTASCRKRNCRCKLLPLPVPTAAEMGGITILRSCKPESRQQSAFFTPSSAAARTLLHAIGYRPRTPFTNCFRCPRSQSGSGGAGAAGGWEADMGGMGSAFGGMQLSNSAGIVRPPSHA